MRKDIIKLVRAMERRGSYRGWIFAYEHPGAFSFYHPKSDVTIYHTPDFNTDGYIDIQATLADQGVNLETTEVVFPVRTAAALFAAVKPYLDKYHPSKGKGRK